MTAYPAERGGRRGRPGIAWALAIVTLIAGPLALALTFSAGSGDTGGQTATAFVFSSLLLAAIWAAGGLGIAAIAGRDRYVRVALPARAALGAVVIGLVFALLCLVGGLVLHAIPLTRSWVGDALDTAHAAPALVVLAIAIIAGAGEELFFRIGLTRLTHGWVRWVVPVTLYALATVATGNIGLVVVSVPLGLVATLLWDRTGRWFTPIIVHAVWSLVMVGLFPLLVG